MTSRDALQPFLEKGAAAATVTGGSWLTVHAVTSGLTILTGFLGVTAAALAVIWWWLKIRREGLEIEKLEGQKNGK